MKQVGLFCALAAIGLAGCVEPRTDYASTPTTANYTETSLAGLSAVRPYPNPDDVCQVIRENDAIREPADNGSFLIACPKHVRGALQDRKSEGAKVLGHAKHWTILTVASK